MDLSTVFFFLFGGIAIASAMLVILNKNPVSSAFSMVLVFFALAGIYALLEAHLVAALQIFVYAGAVMVLFVFVIMLLSADAPTLDFAKSPVWVRLLSGVMGLALFGALVWTFRNFTPAASTGPYSVEAIARSGGNSRVLALSLFSEYLLPFELTSAVLLAAVVGAVTLAKRKPKGTVPSKRGVA